MERLFCVLIAVSDKATEVIPFHTIVEDSKSAFKNAENYLEDKGIKDYKGMSCTIVRNVDGKEISF